MGRCRYRPHQRHSVDMEKKQPNKPKGFRFNFYWVYGIIAIIFFSIQLMSANKTAKKSAGENSTQKCFKKMM